MIRSISEYWSQEPPPDDTLQQVPSLLLLFEAIHKAAIEQNIALIRLCAEFWG